MLRPPVRHVSLTRRRRPGHLLGPGGLPGLSAREGDLSWVPLPRAGSPIAYPLGLRAGLPGRGFDLSWTLRSPIRAGPSQALGGSIWQSPAPRALRCLPACAGSAPSVILTYTAAPSDKEALGDLTQPTPPDRLSRGPGRRFADARNLRAHWASPCMHGSQPGPLNKCSFGALPAGRQLTPRRRCSTPGVNSIRRITPRRLIRIEAGQRLSGSRTITYPSLRGPESSIPISTASLAGLAAQLVPACRAYRQRQIGRPRPCVPSGRPPHGLIFIHQRS